MINLTEAARAQFARLRDQFKTRDVILHDGRDLKRFSVPARTQAAVAGAGIITLCFSMYGVAQAAVALSGVAGAPLTAESKVASMEAKVAAMEVRVAAIKRSAVAHAERVDKRQAIMTAVLVGKASPAALMTSNPTIDAEAEAAGAEVVAPLARVERRQISFAVKARFVAAKRMIVLASSMRRLGIEPSRLMTSGGMGGPYEAADSAEATADLAADAQFRALFQTWKKLDSLEKGLISIPSVFPTSKVAFTSNFGIRSDPFTRTAAFHAGVDIPGAIGTPVYATADGVVDRAGWAGGYGNLIEIDHGRGIATRYGHLSKILITMGAKVKRGQLIGLLGSTGRSTGPHLHYEVRIDGRAVNPVPFLQSADYLLTIQDRSLRVIPTTTLPSAD